ncbi:MAG: PAS domain-containing sensor histidine kinase [Bacteroidales bacterium]|jgi:PAS domain S-box-containing protein
MKTLQPTREELESSLFLEQDRINLFIDLNIVGVIIAAVDGKVIRANDYYLNLLGFSREEFDTLKLDWRSLTPPEWIPADEYAISELRQKGRCTPYEKEYIRRDGSRVAVLLSDAMLPGPQEHIAAFAIDITEKKLAENEIKSKNKELQDLVAAKDKLFSIIAHDLKSPFTSFLGFTRMMVDDLPSLRLEEIQKMALSMRKSADNLYILLENLLEWSRIERGITSFDPQSISLLPKITESLQSVHETANKKEIQVSLDVSKDLKVFCECNMLSSIIRNLIYNAVKYTQRGGKVNVTAKPVSGNMVEISVRDNGIGMEQDLLDKLFQLNDQTSSKGTDGEPSTGLGLIICKDFVEKHQGNIWAESEIGKGSTFHFTLPSSDSAQPPPSSP